MVIKRHNILFVVALLLPSSGCLYVQSREGVVGTYHLASGNQQILLDLSTDGNFTETIRGRNGEVTKQVGRWGFDPAGSVLTLDSLWIPKQFAPEHIVRADENNNGQPRYTEPGHWVITPTYEWGTVTLTLFPGDDIGFRRPTPFKFLFMVISLLIIGYGSLQCFAPRELAKLGCKLHRSANTPQIVRDGFFDRFFGFVFVGVGAYVLLATLAL